MARRFATLALVAALVATAGYSRAALERLETREGSRELLYLPSGKHLRLMSLGHENLLADAIYIWAIQYYSNYTRENRTRWVEHVFSRVITELDPHYTDAYWLGALILILEAGDLDAGVALLEKGADRNPDNWILPYLAGWECFHAGRLDRSAAFFERAARVPGAPAVVRRMRAGLLAETGDLEAALQMWSAILEDPASDAQSQRIATRKVRELRTRIDLRDLAAALARFRDDNGRWPSTLEELVDARYLDALPRDPDGVAYRYEPSTGRVSSSSGLVLGAT